MSEDFKIEKKRYKGKILVEITGSMNLANAKRYKEEMFPLLERSNQEIILDLGKVPYIDSIGINSLVKTSEDFKAKDGIVGIICDQKSHVYSVMKVVGVTQLFRYYASQNSVN